jgi:cold-inducible RNA-binding protein
MSDMDNQQTNKNKLFVGNLPFSISQDDIRAMFESYGEITAVNLITDRMTGRSKGFAFVEFTTEEAAKAAVEALHETEVDGRKIIVNVARPMKPREDRRGGRDDRRSFDRNDRGGNRW